MTDTTEVHQLQLADGRLIDLRVSGPADGIPLVFHHGTPSSGYQRGALQQAAHARGLRLVTTSRPGYGGSSPQPGRQVVDVVADTSAVLAHLGISQCLVSGWSGGGPHALACGARLSAAAAVLVIAGVGPYDADDLDFLAGMGEDNILEMTAALQGEDAVRPFMVARREEQRTAVTPERIFEMLDTLLPDVDRAVLTPQWAQDLAASYADAQRLGIEGWLEDDVAFVRPWGFDLSEISVPTAIWQGSADLMVPFAHGQWLAAHVPGAIAHLEEGQGHLSIAVGALDRMLDELIAVSGLR